MPQEPKKLSSVGAEESENSSRDIGSNELSTEYHDESSCVQSPDSVEATSPPTLANQVIKSEMLYQPEEQPINQHATTANRFMSAFLTLDDLAARNEPDDWVLDGLFCRGDLGMLFGPSGGGKTFIALDLAIAVAIGQSWCGNRFVPPRPLRVVYCTGEGNRGIPNRVKALQAYYAECGIDTSNAQFWYVALAPQLFNFAAPDGADAFIEAYIAKGLPSIDLLILDTLHCSIHGADENSNRDAGTVLASLDKIRERLGGCAILLVHHGNKQDGRERGASAYRASMDFMFLVDQGVNGSRTMKCDKLKDGDPFENQTYMLEPYGESVVVRWSEGVDRSIPLRERVIAFMRKSPDTWYTARELADAIQSNQNSINPFLTNEIAVFDSRPTDPTKSVYNRNPKQYRLK